MAKILIVDDKLLHRSVLTTLLGYHGRRWRKRETAPNCCLTSLASYGRPYQGVSRLTAKNGNAGQSVR